MTTAAIRDAVHIIRTVVVAGMEVAIAIMRRLRTIPAVQLVPFGSQRLHPLFGGRQLCAEGGEEGCLTIWTSTRQDAAMVAFFASAF
jgi:hypothetical protein